jgi:hypothetical protein
LSLCIAMRLSRRGSAIGDEILSILEEICKLTPT